MELDGSACAEWAVNNNFKDVQTPYIPRPNSRRLVSVSPQGKRSTQKSPREQRLLVLRVVSGTSLMRCVRFHTSRNPGPFKLPLAGHLPRTENCDHAEHMEGLALHSLGYIPWNPGVSKMLYNALVGRRILPCPTPIHTQNKRLANTRLNKVVGLGFVVVV